MLPGYMKAYYSNPKTGRVEETEISEATWSEIQVGPEADKWSLTEPEERAEKEPKHAEDKGEKKGPSSPHDKGADLGAPSLGNVKK